MGLDATEVGVLVGGTVLIALILWYFFGAREDPAAVDAGAEGTKPRAGGTGATPPTASS